MQELKTCGTRFDMKRVRKTLANAKSAAGKRKRRLDDKRSLWDELDYCYGSVKESQTCNNILEPLVLSGQVKVSFFVNLLPDQRGYSVVLASKNGSEPDSVVLPYEDKELLDYLDAEQIPPVLADILEDCQSCFYYDGCLIAEVRDYRCYHVNAAAHRKHFLLLRPTNQTVISATEKLAQDMTEDERVELESKLLLATQRPLCLDPSPDVLAISSQLNEIRGQYDSVQMRKAIKRQSPIAHSRVANYVHYLPPDFDVITQLRGTLMPKRTKLILAENESRASVESTPNVSLDETHRQVRQVADSKRASSDSYELIQEVEVIRVDKQGATHKFCIFLCQLSGKYEIIQYEGQNGRFGAPTTRSYHENKNKAEMFLRNFLCAEHKGRSISKEDIVNKFVHTKIGFVLNPRWEDGCQPLFDHGLDTRCVRPSDVFLTTPVALPSTPNLLVGPAPPPPSSSATTTVAAAPKRAAATIRRHSLPSNNIGNSTSEGLIPLSPAAAAAATVTTTTTTMAAKPPTGRPISRPQRRSGPVRNRRQTLPLTTVATTVVATVATMPSSIPLTSNVVVPMQTTYVNVAPATVNQGVPIQVRSPLPSASVAVRPVAPQQSPFSPPIAAKVRPGTGAATMTTMTTQVLSSSSSSSSTPRIPTPQPRPFHFFPSQSNQPVFIRPSGSGSTNAGGQTISSQLLIRPSQAQLIGGQPFSFMHPPSIAPRSRAQRKGGTTTTTTAAAAAAAVAAAAAQRRTQVGPPLNSPLVVLSGMPNQHFSGTQAKLTLVQLSPAQQLAPAQPQPSPQQHARQHVALATGQVGQQMIASVNSGQILPASTVRPS